MMLKAFLKWFLIAQGIIWSLVTPCLLIFKLSFEVKEILFAWIIAILFAVVLMKVDSRG